MLRNLKLQIALSFFGLLSIGMFLLAFVLLVLWHNNIVTLQTTHLQSKLRSIKETFETTDVECSQLYDMAAARRLLGEEMVSCLVIVKDGEMCDAPKSCGDRENLETIMRRIAGSGEEYFSFQENNLGHYFSGKQSYVAATKLVVGGKTVGALAMSGSLEPVYSSLVKGAKIALVYIFVNAFLLTVVGLYRMFKFIVRPLEHVVQLADEYNDKSPAGSFIQPPSNEFSQVAFRLMQMMKRIEADNLELRASVDSLQKLNEELQQARSEVIRAEKLASVGRLSAGLAHEVGNPLGIVKGYLGLIGQEDISAKESWQFALRAHQEVVRIENIVGQLLDCSRQPQIKRVSVNICELLEDLFGLFEERRFSRRVSFTRELPDSTIIVKADYDSLRQVFLNCLLNSIDAVEEKTDKNDGHISVTTYPVMRGESQQYVVVEIADNGVGVDSKDLDNIFDPFFTTKEPGKGTGLGLAVSYTLIEQLDGTMSLRNLQEGGACVSIELPCEAVSLLHPAQ